MLKKQPRLFWLGLLLYVVSFFLVVANTDTDPAPGYAWAGAALIFPFAFNSDSLEHGRAFADMPFIYAAAVISGWINIVFIGALVTAQMARRRLVFFRLRMLVMLMIPFSWIVFYRFAFIPREGYVLWVTGIVMTLFSCSRMKTSDPDTQSD